MLRKEAEMGNSWKEYFEPFLWVDVGGWGIEEELTDLRRLVSLWRNRAMTIGVNVGILETSGFYSAECDI